MPRFGGELMPFGRPGGFGGLFGSMFGQMNQMMQEQFMFEVRSYHVQI